MANKELKGLVESRDEKQAENETVLAAHEERVNAWKELPEETRGDEPQISDEDADAILERNKEIDKLDKRIDEEAKQARKMRAIAEARKLIAPVVSDEVQAEVVHEPMVYGPESDASYYADIMRAAHGVTMPGSGSAMQRLSEWAHQIEREVADDSTVGQMAVKSLRTHFRGDDVESTKRALAEIRDRGRVALDQKDGVEQRSIVTGGGATAAAASGGAAFVSPAIFLGPYAPYREYGRAFADACHQETLPDTGMQIYIPHVTGPAGVRQQTEGQAIQETDPTFGYLNAAVVTLAGEVTVSQQQLDRSGPGFAFDRMIFDQLMRDYTPQWDTYVINAALSGATTQSWSGNSNAFALYDASGAGGFVGQVNKAKNSIRSLAGTVLNPTNLFVIPNRWGFIDSYADSTGRPLIGADYQGPYNVFGGGSTDGDEGIEGYTGYRLGGLPVSTDANIPNLGTTGQDQAIVADLQEVFCYEGTPVTRAVPQTLAGSLLTLLQLYNYVAVLVRYPTGVVVINGTGMGAISYTN